MTLNFVEKINLSKGNDLIMTYRGQLAGSVFFAYIRCEKAGVELMKADYESKTPRALEEYGQVIYRDSIKDPDEKAKEFLKNWIKENGGTVF